jgi:hypothetical protein
MQQLRDGRETLGEVMVAIAAENHHPRAKLGGPLHRSLQCVEP